MGEARVFGGNEKKAAGKIGISVTRWLKVQKKPRSFRPWVAVIFHLHDISTSSPSLPLAFIHDFFPSPVVFRGLFGLDPFQKFHRPAPLKADPITRLEQVI